MYIYIYYFFSAARDILSVLYMRKSIFNIQDERSFLMLKHYIYLCWKSLDTLLSGKSCKHLIATENASKGSYTASHIHTYNTRGQANRSCSASCFNRFKFEKKVPKKRDRKKALRSPQIWMILSVKNQSHSLMLHSGVRFFQSNHYAHVYKLL